MDDDLGRSQPNARRAILRAVLFGTRLERAQMLIEMRSQSDQKVVFLDERPFSDCQGASLRYYRPSRDLIFDY